MPSKRMIHPSFWESETISRYTMFQRLFFAGLFSTADDQGRHKAHPVFLRSRIFPYDEIDIADIDAALDRFEADERIIRYTVDGKAYLQLLNWWTWQQPSWAWPSEHPAPEGWTDRIKYRKGNLVVVENWGDDEPETEPCTNPESAQSEPTMTPPRPHHEPTLGSAPSGSGSSSSSSSGNDSGSSSNGAGTRADPTPAAFTEEDQDLLDLIATVPRMDMGAVRPNVDKMRQKATWNMTDVSGWVAEGKRAPPEIGAALVIARLLEGIPPPADPDSNPRRFVEGLYAEFIQH